MKHSPIAKHFYNGKSPPWFSTSVTLPSTTSDDIEVRICDQDEGTHNEDTPIQLLEIFVQ
jgi:hypothetical protein